MTTVSGARISVDLPAGWEGMIDEGGAVVDGATRHAVVHLANFPLPARRGDYGGGAVDLMAPGDVLVVLLEFDRASTASPLFAPAGIPRPLRAADFGRDTLQRPIPGHGGVQRFFTEAGRAFCLYVVVGSHIDRADVMADLNRILDALVIRP